MELSATRAMLMDSKEEIEKVVKSQDLPTPSIKAEKYLCSIFSLVSRLPPMEFVEYNKMSYMRLHSDD